MLKPSTSSTLTIDNLVEHLKKHPNDAGNLLQGLWDKNQGLVVPLVVDFLKTYPQDAGLLLQNLWKQNRALVAQLIPALWKSSHVEHILTLLKAVEPLIDMFIDTLEPRNGYFTKDQYPQGAFLLNMLRVYHQAAQDLPFDSADLPFARDICQELHEEYGIVVKHTYNEKVARKIYTIEKEATPPASRAESPTDTPDNVQMNASGAAKDVRQL